MRDTNYNDLPNFNFTFKTSIFLETYLEPSPTSMMKFFFAKMAESVNHFSKKSYIIKA